MTRRFLFALCAAALVAVAACSPKKHTADNSVSTVVEAGGSPHAIDQKAAK